jgi:hypothetical protein
MNDVLRIWGPCDQEFGSGVEYWVYKLDDGRTVVLLFDQWRPPYALLSATVADPQQNVIELFNAMTTRPSASNPATQR